MQRREYPANMTINGVFVTKVIIDPHYETKHSSNINDSLILELLKTLDGKFHQLDSKKNGFVYFVTANIK